MGLFTAHPCLFSGLQVPHPHELGYSRTVLLASSLDLSSFGMCVEGAVGERISGVESWTIIGRMTSEASCVAH